MIIREYRPGDNMYLFDFFKSTESEYLPPLSQRPGGIDGFLQEWRDAEGKAAVIPEDNSPTILASMGWAVFGDDCYVDWIAVRDNLRRAGLATNLVKYTLNQMNEVKTAFARTWDSNMKSRGLMEGLGARVITREGFPRRIRKAFSLRDFPGRTTVWYKIDLAEASRRLGLKT